MIKPFYGVNEFMIGADEFLVKCPSCECHSWADVLVKSKYYHFYFLPMWPVGKEADIICQKCGLKRFGLSYDHNLIGNPDDNGKRFRHPWVSYLGLIILILIVVGIILVSL